MATTKSDVDIKELTPEEGMAPFDAEARRRLGMSGDEFIEAWKAGKFRGPERTEVTAVAMLLPLVDEDLLYGHGAV